MGGSSMRIGAAIRPGVREGVCAHPVIGEREYLPPATRASLPRRRKPAGLFVSRTFRSGDPRRRRPELSFFRGGR
jgi:hypothetical protein